MVQYSYYTAKPEKMKDFFIKISKKGDIFMSKLQFNAPVILGVFFISLVSLALGVFTGGASTSALFSVYRSSLASPLTYIRFVGHIFGHANAAHFFNNMLLLLVVGPPLEKIYGSQTIAIGILITAVVTGIIQFVFFPGSALLGASGIVFMLIMLSSLTGAKNGQIPVTLILVALMYLGQEVYSIVFIKDNVANLTHIIGGVCGIVMGFVLTGKNPV